MKINFHETAQLLNPKQLKLISLVFFCMCSMWLGTWETTIAGNWI